jgi:hypothetical protein
MEQASDARISPETLQRLRILYQSVAAKRDFDGLSAFERWLVVRAHAAEVPPPVSGTELAALDTLDVTLKLQLLKWMSGGRDASRAR